MTKNQIIKLLEMYEETTNISDILVSENKNKKGLIIYGYKGAKVVKTFLPLSLLKVVDKNNKVW